MKQYLSGLLAALLFCWLMTAASAQTPPHEIATLCQHLRLPPSAVIAPAAASLTVPSSRPLRLLVVAGPDVKVEQNIRDWADAWNRESGARYGSVSLVGEMAAADLILSWYSAWDEMRVKPRSMGDLPGGSRAQASAPIIEKEGEVRVPVYLHLLDSQEGQWRIVQRRRIVSNGRLGGRSGRQLWEWVARGLRKDG